jgi:hypothetical protein
VHEEKRWPRKGLKTSVSPLEIFQELGPDVIFSEKCKAKEPNPVEFKFLFLQSKGHTENFSYKILSFGIPAKFLCSKKGLNLSQDRDFVGALKIPHTVKLNV